MSEETTQRPDLAEALRGAIRKVRGRYDALDRGPKAVIRRCRTAAELELDRGPKAVIRRCRTAAELELESSYWRIVGDAARTDSSLANLAHVVLLFPHASQATSDRFSFGAHLRGATGESSGATLRFRRALDSRDRDELDHRVRGLLKLAAKEREAVDWGALGVDLLWFFGEKGFVRRRWAQDFYAPLRALESSSPIADSVPTNDRLRK